MPLFRSQKYRCRFGQSSGASRKTTVKPEAACRTPKKIAPGAETSFPARRNFTAGAEPPFFVQPETNAEPESLSRGAAKRASLNYNRQ
jgi:hypothetical protein